MGLELVISDPKSIEGMHAHELLRRAYQARDEAERTLDPVERGHYLIAYERFERAAQAHLTGDPFFAKLLADLWASQAYSRLGLVELHRVTERITRRL
ncbi:MAG TPA: hypothetical protein VJG90_08780 [Candidatus Nanoarchaeia archaeon]|nr:hypothetical protein [Candidatus Nanoarchaeia archaeon]